MSDGGAVLPVSLVLFLAILTAVAVLLVWLVPMIAGYVRRRWPTRGRPKSC